MLKASDKFQHFYLYCQGGEQKCETKAGISTLLVKGISISYPLHVAAKWKNSDFEISPRVQQKLNKLLLH